jgi:hypothetical protein
MKVTWTTAALGDLAMEVPEERLEELLAALRKLGFTPQVHATVTVEVDVATARPPRTHARMYTTLSVERRDRHNVQVDAEETAILMAMAHPHVVMATGARVIDWEG